MKKKSAKILNLSFFMSLVIVWAHSRLPMLPGIPEYYGILSIFNMVSDIAVSTFFFITAYLFFRTFTLQTYAEKLRTRIRTLLVPYILWNILSALAWYLLCINGRPFITDNITFGGPLQLVGDILSCQYSILWYIGVIIIYAIASPLLYLMVRNKKAGIMFILISAVVAVVFRHPFCSPVLWLPIYLSGVWIGLHKPDFMFGRQPLWLSVAAVIGFPLVFWLDKTNPTSLTMNMLQWAGPVLAIGVYDIVERFHTIRSHTFYRYSFFLYATHYIPIHFIQRYVIVTNLCSPAACLAAYLAVPVATVVCSLTVAWLMERYLPRVYALLTGNR